MISTDLLIESIRALVLLVLVAYLWRLGRNRGFLINKGWRYIQLGILLILFGTFLDITDNFDSLNRFVVIGDTEVEAFLEKVVGYLGGFTFLSLGLITWAPTVTAMRREVNERKTAEAALKKAHDELEEKVEERTAALSLSETRFRDFANVGADWFWETGPDLRISHIEGRVEEVSGRLPQDFVGKTREEVYGKNQDYDSPGWQSYYNCIKKRLPFSDHELQWERPDGGFRNISVSGCPIFDEDGNFKGYRGVSRDITQRKKDEIALKTSEERFRTLFYEFPVGVALEDYSDVKKMIDQLVGEGIQDFRSHFENHPQDLTKAISLIKIIGANDNQLSLFGAINFKDYIKKENGWYENEIEKDWRQFYMEEISAFASGKTEYSREVKNVSNNGKETFVYCISKLVSGCEEDWSEVFSVDEDISARKQLEEQVRNSQKMDAVSHLTGGIAHDFNNILGIVMGNLEILHKIVKDNKNAQGRVDTALQGVKRGADLTKKLLGFSRQESHGSVPTSINELIGNLKDLLAKSLTGSIDIKPKLAKDLWLVEVDPGDLQDTIINLSLNAVDAMPAGGRLLIETTNKVIDKDNLAPNSPDFDGEFVLLKISDTGHGMSPEIQEKMFDPFFSTKPEGQGTGLGLSMVFGFVQRSGGHIKIDTEPYEGTTVRIYLPRLQEIEMVDTETAPEIDLPGGRETILVVDDEEDLAEIAVMQLEDLGYKAFSVNNGKQALRELNDNSDIDLLFSDIIMPGELDGYQLARAALKARPSLKILLTSGFTKKKENNLNPDDPIQANLANNLLPKPYNQAELASAVRDALNEKI